MSKNTKKIISVILCAILCLCTLPVISLADDKALIGTAEELLAFAEAVNSGTSADAVLTANITVSGDYICIGTEENPYAGSFDGAGYFVTTESYDSGNVAIFAYTEDAVIENLTARNCTFSAPEGEDVAAAIVANASNSVIKNCAVIGCDVEADGYAGGVVALADNCVITGCTTSANTSVYGYTKYCAGIAACAKKTTISECTNSAVVSGVETCAGIAGYSDGTVSECVCDADIEANGAYGAGIVAMNNGLVIKCLNTGSVKAEDHAAGIASVAQNGEVMLCGNTGDVKVLDDYAAGVVCVISNSDVADCYNTGSVTGANSVYSGVFADLISGSVVNCYNAGVISGNCKTNPGIGSKVSGTVTNCYTTDTAQKTFFTAAGAEITNCKRLSAEALADAESYEGWDFETTWQNDHVHGFAYPALRSIEYHNIGNGVVTEPGCLAGGYTTYLCTTCGALVEKDYTLPAGHKYDALSYKEANCVEDGYGDYLCSVCGDAYSEEVPATGHTDANKDGKCDVCGTSMAQQNAKNIFQKIADFFKSIFEWIKNIFSKIFG